MKNALIERSQRFSKPSLTMAIILIVLGLLAIILPGATTVGVVKILAALIILSGLTQLINHFQTESSERNTWRLLAAILYIAVGIYLMARPVVGLAGLTLVLALFLVAEGILDVAAYFMTRKSHTSSWLLVHGIVAVLFGLLIWNRWPSSSFRAVGILVGISMLLTGVTRLMMALEVRKLAAARGD